MKEKRNGCTNSSPVSIVSSLRQRFDFKKPILKLPLHINSSGGSRARGGGGGGEGGEGGGRQGREGTLAQFQNVLT